MLLKLPRANTAVFGPLQVLADQEQASQFCLLPLAADFLVQSCTPLQKMLCSGSFVSAARRSGLWRWMWEARPARAVQTFGKAL